MAYRAVAMAMDGSARRRTSSNDRKLGGAEAWRLMESTSSALSLYE